MRWENASHVEEVVWMMRLSDMVRGENRAIVQRQFNGDAPFDEDKAVENSIEVNRNFLEGVNLMSQARRQWNQAFLKPGNYFSVGLDSGVPHKRLEWGHSITRHANRGLKRDRNMMEQIRATGANVMLFGPGPSTWDTRRSVIPRPLPISSVLIPSETEISFENLSYFAIFREWTPAQLYEMTHGSKVDPGWNMELVNSQMKYVGEQVQKQPNATAFQYQPERIEELSKQDGGMWGSDAVPTIDCWEFYHRENEDGKGWYRRIILDWGVDSSGYSSSGKKPDHQNKEANGKFLYTSGNRKFANSLSEIFHCNMGDTSAVAPFKYHSIRSLGWMLWGVVDIQNRLSCKFTEAVFEQLMWFFRTANNSDLIRLKKANFFHMGVIPAGIEWVKASDRFTPDMPLLQMAFARNRQLMSENAAAFTQDFDKGTNSKEMTATETMARVNQVNALVSGMLSLAYTYETFKYREICRRLCIRGNPDPIARAFRLGCLTDGVPPEMLDVQKWDVEPERVLGGGNKTLEMAQVQALQGMRKNLGPDAQRRIDHIAVEATTDDPYLAEDLAPVDGQKIVSNSMHDAQLSTDRLMRGLPLLDRPDMVYEDYVKVWIADLGLMVGRAKQTGGMATADQIMGFHAVAQKIGEFLQILAQDPEEKPKATEYAKNLGNLMNEVKAFEQRLQEQMKKQAGQNGQGGPDPKDLAKIAAEGMKAQQKLKQMQQSHGARTAQKQVQMEMTERRKDRESAAQIRRDDTKAAHDLAFERIRSLHENENENNSTE